MKAIGGYFELELPKKGLYHKNALALNSGRNALKYILQSQNINHVYIPLYCCDSLIEPFDSIDVSYSFYSINQNFEVRKLPNISDDEKLLYINYFGLKDRYIAQLAEQLGQKLIVDNVQAFFTHPLEDIDTFYSPRKFFGVPDGGYLYTQHLMNTNLNQDVSIDRTHHLLGRIEYSASEMYTFYRQAENQLNCQPLKYMSNLTHCILECIDYDFVQNKRYQNFAYLHENLKDNNLLTFSAYSTCMAPMAYPFLPEFTVDRKNLAKYQIYIPTYWPEVLSRSGLTHEEKLLTTHMLPLPIDQRLDKKHLDRIISSLCHKNQKD